jgi:hypothetical protein
VTPTRRSKGAGVGLALLAAVLLAGCGSGDAAHVVGSPTRSDIPVATTVAPTSGAGGGSSTSAPPPSGGSGTTSTGAPTTAPADSGLPNQATVDEVESELQQLSTSLQQASHDLSSTQGDN